MKSVAVSSLEDESFSVVGTGDDVFIVRADDLREVEFALAHYFRDAHASRLFDRCPLCRRVRRQIAERIAT